MANHPSHARTRMPRRAPGAPDRSDAARHGSAGPSSGPKSRLPAHARPSCRPRRGRRGNNRADAPLRPCSGKPNGGSSFPRCARRSRRWRRPWRRAQWPWPSKPRLRTTGRGADEHVHQRALADVEPESISEQAAQTLIGKRLEALEINRQRMDARTAASWSAPRAPQLSPRRRNARIGRRTDGGGKHPA